MFALFVVSAAAFQMDVAPRDLCSRAPTVAVVEVTSSEVRWSSGPRGGLETHTWVHVERTLKGSLGSESPQILTLGGLTDRGVRQWVEDEAQLELDHRYLVFLKPRNGVYRVFGGELGVFPLAHGQDASAVQREVCR